MDDQTIRNLDETYLAGTYGRFPVAIVGGKGATLKGADGKEYIDFGSGIGVNIFGACDEGFNQAVSEQLQKIAHVSNYYYSEPQVRLAEALAKRTGCKKVFLCNSGGEANECAFKTARKYSYEKYGAGRAKIVSLSGSFHGRTLFTLTATGQDEFHKYFDPFVPEVEYAKPTMSSVEAHAKGACAVIIEPVQGEGGVNALNPAFVKALASFCKEKDILLIVDEVQTGNGRTGKLYAYEHFGIAPDIVTTAKGLGGGLPIGACMFFEKTADVLKKGDHGSTFGGNPVSCAAACYVLSRIDENLLLEVQAKSDYMRAKLKGFDGVDEVTGLGLMIGIKSKKSPKDVALECLKRGLLVLTAHDKVRLLPPLTIKKTEMDEGLSVLKEVLK